MEATQAAEYVNALAHHPDVELTAIPITERFEDTIAVRIRWPHAVNSNEEFAPSYNGDPIGPLADYVVDCTGLTEDALHGVLVDLQVDAFCHEVREFTRDYRNGRWTAPFHPHRHDGQAAWHHHRRRHAEPDDVFGPKFDKAFTRVSS